MCNFGLSIIFLCVTWPCEGWKTLCEKPYLQNVILKTLQSFLKCSSFYSNFLDNVEFRWKTHERLRTRGLKNIIKLLLLLFKKGDPPNWRASYSFLLHKLHIFQSTNVRYIFISTSETIIHISINKHIHFYFQNNTYPNQQKYINFYF